MPANKDQTGTFNFGRKIDIGSLISAPLIASSKANVVMLAGQTRFLLEYCFKKDEKNDIYEPYMINMVMTRGVLENSDSGPENRKIRRAELVFSVPLLCLVPLNSLAINKVSIDFDLDITAATSKDSKTANNTQNKVIKKAVHLFGNIARSESGGPDSQNNKHYRSPVSGRLKINIDAAPLPLPTGILTLIDLFTKGIQPLESPDHH